MTRACCNLVSTQQPDWWEHVCIQATLELAQLPQKPKVSSMTKQQFLEAVETVREHIQAGDVFQLVLSQRFQRRTFADPFEIYRYSAPAPVSFICR